MGVFVMRPFARIGVAPLNADSSAWSITPIATVAGEASGEERRSSHVCDEGRVLGGRWFMCLREGHGTIAPRRCATLQITASTALFSDRYRSLRKEDVMFRSLYDRLTVWLSLLRSIAEWHPAVFSVSAWSVPGRRHGADRP